MWARKRLEAKGRPGKYRGPAFKVCIIQKVGIVLIMLNAGLCPAVVVIATPKHHRIGRRPHPSVGSVR